MSDLNPGSPEAVEAWCYRCNKDTESVTTYSMASIYTFDPPKRKYTIACVICNDIKLKGWAADTEDSDDDLPPIDMSKHPNAGDFR